MRDLRIRCDPSDRIGRPRATAGFRACTNERSSLAPVSVPMFLTGHVDSASLGPVALCGGVVAASTGANYCPVVTRLSIPRPDPACPARPRWPTALAVDGWAAARVTALGEVPPSRAPCTVDRTRGAPGRRDWTSPTRTHSTGHSVT